MDQTVAPMCVQQVCGTHLQQQYRSPLPGFWMADTISGGTLPLPNFVGASTNKSVHTGSPTTSDALLLLGVLSSNSSTVHELNVAFCSHPSTTSTSSHCLVRLHPLQCLASVGQLSQVRQPNCAGDPTGDNVSLSPTTLATCIDALQRIFQ